ncbi:MAG: hypothetical protein ACRC3Y_15160 [Romboutsia sp.]|uniref:hypothetical protein n=1 Tax=Romboutsia sp. TaxID=1965302 RepID=UPI003F315050
MNENNILRLIEKFEESLESTEKLAETMMGLEGALKNLDTSIYEIYELTKVEGITNKGSELLQVLENIKKTQVEVNEEYNELININLYREDLKGEIKEIKESIKLFENNINIEVNNSTNQIKDYISSYHKVIENNQQEMKEEILIAIKEMIDNK